MNAYEYRCKVLRRTFRRCLTAALITAAPGIIMGIFNRWLLLFALFAVIPVINLVDKIFIITKWHLAEGIIEDVTLFNDFDQPCTEAHIRFMNDDAEHECIFTIGHYGDYEDGIEPELEKMLQKDKGLFLKKTVPVFCSPQNAERCMVYLEDSK
ncbi:MAG: hypothetical protein J6I96_00465 [Oscillospiraceae bacterium]|nr:hypothetical protein [Oscillospiraceae bacterium]